MAIETVNVVHLIATLDLSNVADNLIILKGAGIRAAHRVSAGIFTITPEEAVDLGGGVAIVTHANATSRIVTAQIQSIAIAGDDNIQINCFTDAGVANDSGPAYLVVYRYPVVA